MNIKFYNSELPSKYSNLIVKDIQDTWIVRDNKCFYYLGHSERKTDSWIWLIAKAIFTLGIYTCCSSNFTKKFSKAWAGKKKEVIIYGNAFLSLKIDADNGDINAQKDISHHYLQHNQYQKAFEYISKAAESKDEEALFYLASYYEAGKGVSQSFEEAAKYYTLSAKQGFRRAQFQLGLMYIQGRGVTASRSEAAKWLKLSSEHSVQYPTLSYLNQNDLQEVVFKLYKDLANEGHVGSQFEIAYCYDIGLCVEPSENDAIDWYTKAATNGHLYSQIALANYYNGRNGELSIKWLTKAASQGHILSQHDLGMHYLNGDGVEKSDAEAEKWFLEAAKKDHPDSQYELGLMLQSKEEFEKAIVWFKKASNSHDEALYELACCYLEGRGTEQSNTEAEKCFEQLSSDSFIDEATGAKANYELAKLYSYRNDQDFNQKAAQLFEAAANARHIESQFEIGYLYLKGKGVEKSDTKAFTWFGIAARNGHVHAQYLTGLCFLEGTGVNQSDENAKHWFEIAADNGDEESKEALKLLQEKSE